MTVCSTLCEHGASGANGGAMTPGDQRWLQIQALDGRAEEDILQSLATCKALCEFCMAWLGAARMMSEKCIRSLQAADG
ncbi:Hypothetical protein NTJ_08678 [Nesidiocoris tenuis]|uniref:Uncharacterized protein n=1 Tax=Nesidiocoris tenuis TaxID=355587 RepID=A0ABN7AUL4_9HEMI|nr:Hypothetical protein NTJ_08678 [Nesidiocoris tenuis]